MHQNNQRRSRWKYRWSNWPHIVSCWSWILSTLKFIILFFLPLNVFTISIIKVKRNFSPKKQLESNLPFLYFWMAILTMIISPGKQMILRLAYNYTNAIWTKEPFCHSLPAKESSHLYVKGITILEEKIQFGKGYHIPGVASLTL